MSDAIDVRLSRIGTVILSVSDLQRSLAFYRDALGLNVRLVAGEFAFLDAGGITFALRTVRRLAPPSDEVRTEVVFHVDDLRRAHDALRARGVAFRVEPRIVTGDPYAADFRDPDGQVLSIFGPRTA